MLRKIVEETLYFLTLLCLGVIIGQALCREAHAQYPDLYVPDSYEQLQPLDIYSPRDPMLDYLEQERDYQLIEDMQNDYSPNQDMLRYLRQESINDAIYELEH